MRCRGEAGALWGVGPWEGAQVKAGWAGTQGTAGTVCVGPGHHFVASACREIKHHSSLSSAHTIPRTQHVNNTLPSLLDSSPSLSFNLQRSLNKKTTTRNQRALPSAWKQFNFLTEFQSNPFTCVISHNYWQHWEGKPCPCCSRMSKGP